MDVYVLVLPVLLVVTLIAVVASVDALRRLRQKLEEQTKTLARLIISHRDLEIRLDRLVAAVDQSRQQLHRALELSSNIHRLIYGTLRTADDVTPEMISTINTYLIELKAIAVVNGDKKFIERVGMLRKAVDYLLTRASDDPTPTITVSEATEEVQRTVYDLLAAATRG